MLATKTSWMETFNSFSIHTEAQKSPSTTAYLFVPWAFVEDPFYGLSATVINELKTTNGITNVRVFGHLPIHRYVELHELVSIDRLPTTERVQRGLSYSRLREMADVTLTRQIVGMVASYNESSVAAATFMTTMSSSIKTPAAIKQAQKKNAAAMEQQSFTGRWSSSSSSLARANGLFRSWLFWIAAIAMIAVVVLLFMNNSRIKKRNQKTMEDVQQKLYATKSKKKIRPSLPSSVKTTTAAS